jgi:hypothetical protein
MQRNASEQREAYSLNTWYSNVWVYICKSKSPMVYTEYLSNFKPTLKVQINIKMSNTWEQAIPRTNT